ncbi:hypothetical protein BCR37DRAFT_389787 [Protomyces lactucae-debilis]|uniref:Uncharacterized protein n=1 Tax=Protomyces lactucae-debilis TaxID=2754530 RepID=A0A1Y2ETC6_PROLT|nr:uncharacterized protein BCR37DRAFT_389787 [Protomyces lactucae-debilis]ORY74818.1 hypothetical protein BCR37DRAFT_389787 [Protomyces lactucae-debilis]
MRNFQPSVASCLCLAVSISLREVSHVFVAASETNAEAASSSHQIKGKPKTPGPEDRFSCNLIYTNFTPNVLIQSGYEGGCRELCAYHFVEMMWHMASIVEPCQYITESTWDILFIYHLPKDELVPVADFHLCERFSSLTKCLRPLIACDCPGEMFLHRVVNNTDLVPGNPTACESRQVIKRLMTLVSSQSGRRASETGESDLQVKFLDPVNVESAVDCKVYKSEREIYDVRKQWTKNHSASHDAITFLNCTLKFQMPLAYIPGDQITCHSDLDNMLDVEYIMGFLADLRRPLEQFAHSSYEHLRFW